MKKYFTRNEFARLRNINVNSLRYYDKIGLLKPAFTDPENSYHYYTAEQLPILDTIILCVNLGLPLKELEKYIDGDGNLDFQELLTHGQQLAQEHINEIQTQLYAIKCSLARLENDKTIIDKQGIYTRSIESRRIVTSPTFEAKLEVANIETEINQLFAQAQASHLSPIMPAGVLIQCGGSLGISHRFFLEIANKEAEHPQIITLPAGKYSCLQTDLHTVPDIYNAIKDAWGLEKEMSIIISNLYKEKFSFKNRPAELQRLIKS